MEDFSSGEELSEVEVGATEDCSLRLGTYGLDDIYIYRLVALIGNLTQRRRVTILMVHSSR